MIVAIGFTFCSATHGQQHPEVARFALEGRARLSRVQLAGERNSERIVTALCRLAREAQNDRYRTDRRAYGVPPWVLEKRRRQFFRVIEVPAGKRGRIALQFETNDPEIRGIVLRAADFLRHVVADQWLPTSTIRVRELSPAEPRPHAIRGPDGACIYLEPGRRAMGTAVHELAHHIEFEHSEVLAASKSFLARRARGGPLLPLSILTGDIYDPDEIAFRANWVERGGLRYSGKIYGSSLCEATATELISTGLERLLREPTNFMAEDADFLLFLLLTLQAQPP